MYDLLFKKIKEKLVCGFLRIKMVKNTKKLNKKKIIITISSILMLVILTSVVLTLNNAKAREGILGTNYAIDGNYYRVEFGGKEVGIVLKKEDFFNVLTDIQKELSEKHNLEIAIKQETVFEDIKLNNQQISSYEEIKDNIERDLLYNVYAYSVNINGEDFAFVESKETAQALLDKVKEPYMKLVDDSSNILNIEIVENVEIIKKDTSLSSIKDYETVLALLEKGTTETKVHVVESGENYWTIARSNKLTVEELIQANPDKNEKLIHPGDEINLIVPKPYLTVVTVEEKTYVKKTQFGKEVEYTSTLYKDQRQVKKKGVYGEVEVLAKVKKHNGIEIEEEILSQVVLSQPTAQIELQGTKPLPPLHGTGVFMRPTRGSFVSGFGMRWGRMHNGIDLASRTGTPIKAADGGVVTIAGWLGNYGLLVEIDHGGGWKTRYGHCSKIYVKVGQKVYKDKTIAAVGNTGNSTGPHVHFEVIKHGVPQNPLNYIDKEYK